MGKMLYLMGKSSTGKDTVYKALLEWKDIQFYRVIPYTTRPIRAGEEEGMEYHFTDEAGFEKLKAQGKVIEARSYHTYHGLWRYFTVDDGSVDMKRHNYLMIGTLESYLKTAEYFGKEKVLPVLLELDDGIRLQRALERERGQEYPKYEEMCRRFLADAEDFSEEKIQAAGIECRICNENLQECLETIWNYIQKRV